MSLWILFKVVQLEEKSDLKARVEAFEKKLYKLLESEKKEYNSSRLAEIRTQGLRRVKAGECKSMNWQTI